MTDEAENTKYRAYLDQRQALIDIEVDSSNRLDRGILTLAGGALGLSITYIEKIAPEPSPSTLWLLGFSWFLLLATLLVSLASHLTSQSGMRRQRDILDLELEKDELTEDEKKNKWSLATHYLNISSMVTFSLGVILLCVFTLCNLPKNEVKNDRQRKAERQIAEKTDNRGSGTSEVGKASTKTATQEKEVDMSNGDMKKNGTRKSSGRDKRAGVVAPKNAKPTPKPKPKSSSGNTSKK